MFRNDYQMDSPEYRTISEMMAKEPISSVTYGSIKLFDAQMSDYVVDIEWSPNVDRELAYYIECELYCNTISVGNTNQSELSNGLYTIDHYKNDCKNNSLIAKHKAALEIFNDLDTPTTEVLREELAKLEQEARDRQSLFKFDETEQTLNDLKETELTQ